MVKAWDGAAFRERLAGRAENLERYRREVRGRITRGQSNGSKPMHDHTLGERWACDVLCSAVETESPHMLRNRIAELQAAPPSETSAFNQAAFETGWQMQLRGLLSEVDEHLADE